MADEQLVVRAALRDELSGPIRDVRGDLADLRREIDRNQRAAAGASRSTTSYGLGLGKLGNIAGRVTGSLARVAKVGLASAGAAAAGASFFILKLGNDYQDTLNTFQAVTRSSGKQMDALRAKAKALGADMRLPATSAADAAAAMTELAKGGLSVQASMDAALGTLQLAGAAGMDGAQAAEIQVQALNQFRLSADKAGMVADVLANTANAASGEITDVALALSYVGPVANSVGESIGGTATAIGLLANNGILGEKSGTALRAVIASLAKPTRQGAAGLKRLGIDAFDAHGRFKGLRFVTDQLAKAQKRMTVEQFNAAAAAAFGREPLAAINALAASGAKSWDGMAKAVGHAGGASEVAAAKTKGLRGAWEGLRSQAETVAIEIYERVAPSLEELVRWLADRLPDAGETAMEWLDRAQKAVGKLWGALQAGDADSFIAELSTALVGNDDLVPFLTDLYDAAKDVGTIVRDLLWPTFRDAASVLGGALTPLGLTRDLLSALADNSEELVPLLSSVLAGFMAYKVITGVIWAVTAAQLALDAAVMANPFVLVAVAIVAFTAAMISAYKHSETLRGVIHVAFAFIKAVMFQFAADAVQIADVFMSVFLFAFRAVVDAAVWAFGWIPGLGDKLKLGQQQVHDFVDGINDSLDKVHDDLIIKADTAQADASMEAFRQRNSGPIYVDAFMRQRGITPTGATGDTATPRTRSGSWAHTAAVVGAIDAATPGRRTMTSGVRGYALGSAGSDHARGRAVDLVGSGLTGFADRVRSAGGYAAFHGSGSTRHLHVAVGDNVDAGGRGRPVPLAPGPVGDTATPRAGSSGGGGGGGLVVMPGGVVVSVSGSTLTAEDIAAAVAAGIEDYVRDQDERSA